MVDITLDKNGRISDVNFVQWIMTEIGDRAFKREQVADTYAILLQKGATQEEITMINTAILNRWSPGGLRWIKEQAWKRAESRQKQSDDETNARR